MMVMTSLKYSLPWRSRLAFPLPNSFPCPLMAYSWQKSSTLQNSSSKLIVDTSCWCDYPQGYSFLAQEVSFFLIPNSRYIRRNCMNLSKGPYHVGELYFRVLRCNPCSCNYFR